jgi:hypothetical protein
MDHQIQSSDPFVSCKSPYMHPGLTPLYPWLPTCAVASTWSCQWWLALSILSAPWSQWPEYLLTLGPVGRVGHALTPVTSDLGLHSCLGSLALEPCSCLEVLYVVLQVVLGLSFSRGTQLISRRKTMAPGLCHFWESLWGINVNCLINSIYYL